MSGMFVFGCLTWSLIVCCSLTQIFNDKSQHDTTEVDTGNSVVDSFCTYSCSPKFRETFEVHKLFVNYNNLRSDYENSPQYSNWIASGQNDGKHFFPDFQNQKPLHVMLHEFLLTHQLFGCALSRVDETYAFDSSASGISELLPGSQPQQCLDPSEFRRQHTLKRKKRKAAKGEVQSTPKKNRLAQTIRNQMSSAKESFDAKRRECEIQDARLWLSDAFKTKLQWKQTLAQMSEGDSDYEDALEMVNMWKGHHSHAKKRLKELEMGTTPLIVDSTDTDTD